jgi:hypothetical protein
VKIVLFQIAISSKARRERACEHLVGEWVCLKPDGNFEKSKHFLGFEVYSAGDGSPFLYYRETDSDESLVFEYYEMATGSVRGSMVIF